MGDTAALLARGADNGDRKWQVSCVLHAVLEIPIQMTRAASAASALAMAKPMPAVEPVTSASLFSS
jgi:hypothetical protein